MTKPLRYLCQESKRDKIYKKRLQMGGGGYWLINENTCIVKHLVIITKSISDTLVWYILLIDMKTMAQCFHTFRCNYLLTSSVRKTLTWTCVPCWILSHCFGYKMCCMDKQKGYIHATGMYWYIAENYQSKPKASIKFLIHYWCLYEYWLQSL